MPKAPKKSPIQPLGPEQWHKPGISDEMFRLIGEVIVRWSWLEASIQDVLWAVAGLPIEDGRVFTEKTDAQRKIQWLRGLASRKLSGSVYDAMVVVLNDIEALRADRNFVAHGSWGTLMPGDIPIALSVREKPSQPDEIVAESFRNDRMDDLIQRIDDAKAKLIAWRDSHETLPKKRPQSPPTE